MILQCFFVHCLTEASILHCALSHTVWKVRRNGAEINVVLKIFSCVWKAGEGCKSAGIRCSMLIRKHGHTSVQNSRQSSSVLLQRWRQCRWTAPPPIVHTEHCTTAGPCLLTKPDLVHKCSNMWVISPYTYKLNLFFSLAQMIVYLQLWHHIGSISHISRQPFSHEPECKSIPHGFWHDFW